MNSTELNFFLAFLIASNHTLFVIHRNLIKNLIAHFSNFRLPFLAIPFCHLWTWFTDHSKFEFQIFLKFLCSNYVLRRFVVEEILGGCFEVFLKKLLLRSLHWTQ